MATQNLEYHEAANIFPLDEGSIPKLAEDIKQHGLLCPIELLDGKIVDGRRRSIACLQAGIKPSYVEAPQLAHDDPVAYVLSLNGETRRHLTKSQLAMVASRAHDLWEKYKKESAKRQREGRKKGAEYAGRPYKDGTPAKTKKSLPTRDGKDYESERRDNSRETTSRIGKDFGVSGKSVERGMNVVNKGAPEVQEAVDTGEISVTRADEIVRTYNDKETQRHELEKELNKPRSEKKEEKKSPAQPVEVEDKKVVLDAKGKRRAEAMNAVTKAIDGLQSSKLFRLPKNNEYFKEGLQEVINWLKTVKRKS